MAQKTGLRLLSDVFALHMKNGGGAAGREATLNMIFEEVETSAKLLEEVLRKAMKEGVAKNLSAHGIGLALIKEGCSIFAADCHASEIHIQVAKKFLAMTIEGLAEAATDRVYEKLEESRRGG